MILYLDTSSLVKLYVEEDQSTEVRRAGKAAEILATSKVAYPEAFAAFARKHRAGELNQTDLGKVCHALKDQWARFAVIDIDEKRAGDLAVKHTLRGFDAVHLAAAVTVRTEIADVDVVFMSFDGRQTAAALAEGFRLTA